MARQTHIEKAIENLKEKRNVLDLAIKQLEEQIVKPAPVRKLRQVAGGAGESQK